jgi:hypothetical protein
MKIEKPKRGKRSERVRNIRQKRGEETGA